MANLDVEISMDCLVVDIDRPWLHAELFTDAELDSGGFDISPGEATLKRMYEESQVPDGKFQQFTSFPTAFVVAADIELSVSNLPLALCVRLYFRNLTLSEYLSFPATLHP